eukprot:s1351_g2.t1
MAQKPSELKTSRANGNDPWIFSATAHRNVANSGRPLMDEAERVEIAGHVGRLGHELIRFAELARARLNAMQDYSDVPTLALQDAWPIYMANSQEPRAGSLRLPRPNRGKRSAQRVLPKPPSEDVEEIPEPPSSPVEGTRLWMKDPDLWTLDAGNQGVPRVPRSLPSAPRSEERTPEPQSPDAELGVPKSAPCRRFLPTPSLRGEEPSPEPPQSPDAELGVPKSAPRRFLPTPSLRSQSEELPEPPQSPDAELGVPKSAPRRSPSGAATSALAQCPDFFRMIRTIWLLAGATLHLSRATPRDLMSDVAKYYDSPRLLLFWPVDGSYRTVKQVKKNLDYVKSTLGAGCCDVFLAHYKGDAKLFGSEWYRQNVVGNLSGTGYKFKFMQAAYNKAQFEEPWETKYDFVWGLDSDVDLTGTNLTKLFRMVKQSNALIAGPTFVGAGLNQRHPGGDLRRKARPHGCGGPVAESSIKLEVSLPSGRYETVKVSQSGTIADLKIAAQQAFGQRFLRLAAPDGRLLDPTNSLQLSGLQDGDSLTAVAQQPKIAATSGAFALWCVGGDRIVTWGQAHAAADSSRIRRQLRSVQQICGISCAFAALLADGSVVTWGHQRSGGDSSRVQGRLRNVRQICSSHAAFAAILPDGRVVTWGLADHGGKSSRVQDRLRNVQQICSTNMAFAAVLADGSVVTWGKASYGGDSSRVQHQLAEVQQIYGTDSAFAAILADGSVVTWGNEDYGADSSRVQCQLRNVQQICGSLGAFAAILADGSVVTWGHEGCGSDSSRAQDQLRNVRQICATQYAFAAILADGSVVTWGNPNHGGDSSTVQHQLTQVQQISSTKVAFAAILTDKTVVTWGLPDGGGDSSRVQHQLRNVQQISGGDFAFAAILADGSVVTWGDPNDGGDSSSVQDQFHCQTAKRRAASHQVAEVMPTGALLLDFDSNEKHLTVSMSQDSHDAQAPCSNYSQVDSAMPLSEPMTAAIVGAIVVAIMVAIVVAMAARFLTLVLASAGMVLGNAGYSGGHNGGYSGGYGCTLPHTRSGKCRYGAWKCRLDYAFGLCLFLGRVVEPDRPTRGVCAQIHFCFFVSAFAAVVSLSSW